MSQCIALLHAGWMGNLTSLGELQTMAGLTHRDAAQLCGVAAETYRRWRTDRTPPLYAFRLLSVGAGFIPWPGWEKWFYNPFDQTLVHVDLKDGFSPAKVAEFLFLRQRYEPATTPKRSRIVRLSHYRQAQGVAAPAGRPPLCRRGSVFASSRTYGRHPLALSGHPLPRPRHPSPGLSGKRMCPLKTASKFDAGSTHGHGP